MKKDTIVAPATPPGRGAVSIIKISGPESFNIARKLTTLKHLKHRTASVAELVDPSTGETLDTVLVLPFKSPHSQTGEDLVEIHLHGNPLLVKKVLEMATALGARIAEPGEFTRRAFENGKIDLIQAESVAEIVAAGSEMWIKHVARAISGRGSRAVEKLRDSLINAAVLLETYIEFPEDDDATEITPDEIISEISLAVTNIKYALNAFEKLSKTRTSGKVVIAGPPNAGKSTLFNALLGFQRVITSPVPGTTRDYVEAIIEKEDLLLKIVDTPGLREASDEIEREGIKLSKKVLEEADIVIVVLDATKKWADEEMRILDLTESSSRIIAVNKIDLVSDVNTELLQQREAIKILKISARTGHGLDEIKKTLHDFFSPPELPEADLTVITEREKQLLQKACEHLEKSIHNLKEGFADLAAEEIREAIRNVEELTGKISTDEILNRIFSTFCIGK